MTPFEALDLLADLIGKAGATVVRHPDGGFHGECTSPRSILQAFCDMARVPAGDPFERHGETLRVLDDRDGDLLLHESGLSVDGNRYGVDLTRQFSFADSAGDYAGMNHLTVSLEADGVLDGRVPRAQRWGYAGRKRRDVSDENEHPEITNWAGHVDAWARAVEGSNSWKVFDHLPVTRFRAVQSDV